MSTGSRWKFVCTCIAVGLISFVSSAVQAGEPNSQQKAAAGDISALLGSLVHTLEAQKLMSNGRWAEAEAKYVDILGLLLKAPTTRPGLILEIETQIAFARYRQNRFPEARDLLSKAIEISHLAPIPPFKEIAQSELTLSVVYFEEGLYTESEKLLRKLIEQPEKRAKNALVIRALATSSLAHLLSQRGENASAKAILTDRIDELGRNRDDDSTFGLVACLSGRGSILYGELKVAEAREAFREALELTRKSKAARGFRIDIATSLASIMFSTNAPDEAMALLTDIRKEFFQDQKVVTRESLIFSINFASAQFRTGQLTEGDKTISDVIGKWPQIGKEDDPVVLAARFVLTDIYLQQKRWNEAEREYRTITDIAGGSSGESRKLGLIGLSRIGFAKAKAGQPLQGEKIVLDARRRQLAASPRDELTFLLSALDLAQVRLLLPGRADALTPAREAAKLFRARVSAIGDSNADETEIGTRSREDVFATLAEADWRGTRTRSNEKAGLGAEALAALQQGTAGTVNQAVVQAALRTLAEARSKGLGALVRERQELTGSLAVTESALTKARIAKSSQESLIKKLDADRSRTLVRLGQVNSQIEQSFPDFANFAQPKQLFVKDVQALLAADEALMFVVPTPYGTHSFAITNSSFDWNRAEWTDERVAAAVHRLLWDCGVEGGVDNATAARWAAEDGGGYSYDRHTAYALYQQIVAPLAKAFSGKRKLYVTATGSLSSLPFGILVTQPPQGRDTDPQALRNSSWMADAFAISVVPTIQSLQLLKGQKIRNVTSGIQARASFAGFGDPLLGGQSASRGSRRGLHQAQLQRSVSQQRGRKQTGSLGRINSLSRLPGTATELEGMRQALNAGTETLYLASRNTEAAVKSTDLSSVSVLAFATHGLMANELFLGAEAGLVFTPPKKQSDLDDGYLTATEIMALRLNAEWVILSACNTAASSGGSVAQSLSGLARSFFYAGAQNLLVSHWPVRDDVAAFITVEAIKLRQANPNLSCAEAVQAAARKVRNDASHDSPDDTWAHPLAWAPFSLVGEGG